MYALKRALHSVKRCSLMNGFLHSLAGGRAEVIIDVAVLDTIKQQGDSPKKSM